MTSNITQSYSVVVESIGFVSVYEERVKVQAAANSRSYARTRVELRIDACAALVDGEGGEKKVAIGKCPIRLRSGSHRW